MAIFLSFILVSVSLTGCIQEEQDSELEDVQPEIQLDQPSILPDWKDGEYHDYYETMDVLNEFQVKYPNLVNLFSIGESVLGKDIWCIRITNENNDDIKSSCLIDGCIHGCEWEAGEACLYLAEYLLINFDKNETITNILNTTEIYIVPLVNPDGRQVDDRFNDNGIDLNRNFDIDFGRIRGGCIPLGKLLGRIKIPYIETPRLNKWFPNFPPYLTNCGRRPFSEPETQALRDFTNELDDFSFYVSCHTAAHCIIGPWGAFKPPFKIPQHEIDIMTYAEGWIEKNTEYKTYRSGEGIVYQGKEVYFSGTSFDWVFKEYHIPSFVFEILSEDYEMWMGQGKHDNLVHWMKTTLPVFMYCLVNIDNLHQWRTPDIQPLFPEGVPPQPL
jgi:carboxypeptidase T